MTLLFAMIACLLSREHAVVACMVTGLRGISKSPHEDHICRCTKGGCESDALQDAGPAGDIHGSG